MAIRNIVARRQDLADMFLPLGVETLLRRIADTQSECRDEARAALRDLGCHIDLHEAWTGTGKQLEQ